MNVFARIMRHARITLQNYQELPSPPFLTLFVTSLCNMKCEHCFFWRHLNGRDDLSKEELFELSRSLGRIENLSLSGGEPFLRKELSEICAQFIRVNGVRQIYVPTNGYHTERIVKQVTETLAEKKLGLFVVELSLDGMSEYHDRFRGTQGALDRAMQTYDALAKVQAADARLRIHSVSTATSLNVDEIRQLTRYLFDRCPKMDHHNLSMIRGDRKNPALLAPDLTQYRELYEYIRRLWAPRESGRYGAIVEPMLQWTKAQIVVKRTQVVPCRAGRLSAVVYAKGDVALCEAHLPIGNVRNQSFSEIWSSDRASRLRASIAARECYCTNAVYLWPSIVYQPISLIRAMVGARVWRGPKSLNLGARPAVVLEDERTRTAPLEQATSDSDYVDKE